MTTHERTDWQAVYVDGGGFWAVYNDNDEGKRLVDDLTKQQAEMGAMLLNTSGLGDLTGWTRDEIADEVEYSVNIVGCDHCNMDSMRVTQDEAGICTECRS